jgi:hypothetical protein
MAIAATDPSGEGTESVLLLGKGGAEFVLREHGVP